MSLKKDINYSIWCDFIERDFLENEFQDIISNQTIHGATSNPAIFQQSITSSTAYEQQIKMLQANETKKIYESLAITDIKRAAELLKPLYDENANDGLISFEVDPNLCNDTQGTIDEGIRLHTQIGFDNVMIKIPATPEGYEAMEHLTELGINVNATLVFSPDQAIKATQALHNGIKKSGKDTKGVVSIFVSRFDRALDNLLKNKGMTTTQTGIINATKCYYEIEKFQNANIRTLFASTGVKDDFLSPSFYVDELIFPKSINTAPLATIKSWLKEGKKEATTPITVEECDKYFKKLKNNRINIDSVYKELLQDGLKSFKDSFEELLSKIKL